VLLAQLVNPLLSSLSAPASWPSGCVWLPHTCPLSFPQVEKLVKYLDPNDLGRINFKDFCRGVFAMKGEAIWGREGPMGSLRSYPAEKLL
jgi:hypothetical protein